MVLRKYFVKLEIKCFWFLLINGLVKNTHIDRNLCENGRKMEQILKI